MPKAELPEQFLKEMDQTIPWAEVSAVSEPFYLKGEGPVRSPMGVERMLSIHFLQQWFTLLERHILGSRLSVFIIAECLKGSGLKVSACAFVDATIITSPSPASAPSNY